MVIFSMDGTECEGRVRLSDKGCAVPAQAKEEECPEAEELLDPMSWQRTTWSCSYISIACVGVVLLLDPFWVKIDMLQCLLRM